MPDYTKNQIIMEGIENLPLYERCYVLMKNFSSEPEG